MTAKQKFEILKPKIFMVETILGCNLKCPECAIGADIIQRKKGTMSYTEFLTIADKIKPYCEYLYLHIWGEPTLNCDIYKIIEYASSFTRTNISTNANTLTEEKAEMLIKSGVNDLIVSIDGFSQKVYEKYRVGGSAKKALLALKQLTDINQKLGGKVNISPQFIVFKHNEHEMDAFKDFCHSIGLKPSFKSPYTRTDSAYQQSADKCYQRPQYQDVMHLQDAMRSCGDPKEVFTILLDGTSVMCCYDHDGITNYGNIYEQDVLDIWNSVRYKNDRFDIITGNAPDYCINNCLSWTLCYPKQSNNSMQEITDFTHAADIVESVRLHGRRQVIKYATENGESLLKQARLLFQQGKRNEAFDIYEQLVEVYKVNELDLLSEVHDMYLTLPPDDRYTLYQSRIYDFGILPGDKVLDIGSGNNPFVLATHLADITTSDDAYGRADVPFKYVDGKPVYEVNLESTNFHDKEFDFVYCSHVLEHVENPAKACDELMRIAKRGYLETPTVSKDIWLNTAKISNHIWKVEKSNDNLIFNKYKDEELNGIGSDVAMMMHINPQSKREKAFSALIYLKPELMNTMLLWNNYFSYKVTQKTESKVPMVV
jgi:MoaA/NifB/PqqE/SkfB family radical SAM enzyme/SAM-dependent methyltransferase